MKVFLNNVGAINGFYGYFEELKFFPIGCDFEIDKIETQFETGEIWFTIIAQYGNNQVSCRVQRKEVYNNNFEKLIENGIDVNRNCGGVFCMVLKKKELAYLCEYESEIFHMGVGWNTITKENNIEGLSAPLGKAYKSFDHIGNIESEYLGDMNIKPCGTLKSQLKFIKKEVIGHTKCEAALAIGLSAVVNGLISDIVKTPNIIVHLYGDSSTGKTTAAQLAVSCAGVPDMQNTSLMMSWNATPNSIITRLKSNRGMPVVMDEVSKFMGSDISSLIYAISDGRDKDRLNRDATLKVINKNDSFSTTLISTGEATISGKCKNNTGLRVRVIEISAQFTEDAMHSNRIKEGCLNNCGFLAPAMAEFMQKKGMDYILDKYYGWYAKYVESTQIDTLKERVGANYAVILTAADLASECFNLSMNLDSILQFFLDNELQNTIERDMAKVAQEKFIEYARANYSHFVKVHHDSKMMDMFDVNDNVEIYGRIDDGIDKPFDDTRKIVGEFSFTKNSFKNICRKLGYEDDRVLLKQLKEKGYLNCESGKLYRKRKLRSGDATATNMYVIYEFKEICIMGGETFVVEDNDDEESPFD